MPPSTPDPMSMKRLSIHCLSVYVMLYNELPGEEMSINRMPLHVYKRPCACLCLYVTINVLIYKMLQPMSNVYAMSMNCPSMLTN